MAERILLIRLGALGDTLQASSVANLLARHAPDVEVDFLVAKGLEDLFLLVPSVCEVYSLPFRRIPFRVHPYRPALCSRLRKRRYRLAYLMETHPRFLPLLERIEAERKVWLGKGAGGPKEDRAAEDLPNPVWYQRRLWQAGWGPREPCAPELVVRPVDVERAGRLLLSLGLDPAEPLVGLHPGNSHPGRSAWRRGFRRTDLRSWPEARWEELIWGMHRARRQLQYV